MLTGRTIRCVILAFQILVLGWISSCAQQVDAQEAIETKAPYGYDRQGKPLRFPPGTVPGMTHANFNSSLPTLWLIGDSTVKEGRDNGRNGGRVGWGHEIPRYFDLDKINVENQALGGTSSRSFMNQYWPSVLEMIRPGDFVTIQFGHNDGGIDSETPRIRARASLFGNGEDTREMTLDDETQETVHSYGWYLRKYIQDIRAAGATPIICSPVPPNMWRDGKVVRGQNYTAWSREAAEQSGVDYLNLNHLIAEQMDGLGKEFTVGAMYRADDPVHPIVLGAQFNAMCVITAIKALEPSLKLNQFLLASAEPLDPANSEFVLAAKEENSLETQNAR